MAYQRRIPTLSNLPIRAVEICALLIGRWQGIGDGKLPDGQVFNYHTTIDFTRHQANPALLKYEEVAYVQQRSEYQFKHSEVGYLIFDERGIQWCSVHNNGRMEHLVAIAQSCYAEESTNIVFDSECIKTHQRLERVRTSRRELIFDSVYMQYNQYMTLDTTPLNHLKISLRQFH